MADGFLFIYNKKLITIVRWIFFFNNEFLIVTFAGVARSLRSAHSGQLIRRADVDARPANTRTCANDGT